MWDLVAITSGKPPVSLWASGSGGTKAKTFNLRTYKLHALGDYPQTIRKHGTTDNYTSQRVGDGAGLSRRHGC